MEANPAAPQQPAETRYWYCDPRGQRQGPVSRAELQTLFVQGLVGPASLAWRPGIENWQPLRDLEPWAVGQGLNSPLDVTNSYAVASLILGCVSLLMLTMCFLGGLAGIPAVICGHYARRQIRDSQMRQKGEGMALAGLITGYISSAIIVIGAAVIFALLLAGWSETRSGDFFP